MNPARLVAAVFGAALIIVPLVATHEGYVPVVYADPAPGAFTTACYGHRIDAPLGKRFTDEQCAQFLADDLLKHGLEIAKCLPDELPPQVRAAFTSLAFNIGSQKFCSSTLARKAKAGDLAGACAQLSIWVKAGPNVLPGLVKRRAAERAICETGLPR